MENDRFLSTRFKIFGLLTEGNSAVEVSEYKSEVMQEKQFQTELDAASSSSSSSRKDTASPDQKLGKGTKKLTPLLPCFHQVTITKDNEEEQKRFILKIHYDEHQYKTVVVSEKTTAMAVCALLASKLSLTRFTFRLYAMKDNSELHCLKETDSVCEFMDKIRENSDGANANIRLLVLRPPPTGTNNTMRANFFIRWLNYQLKGAATVKNLKTDLLDGSILCLLAENLTGNKPEFTVTDTKKAAATALNAALDVLEKSGITLPPDSTSQILSGSSKNICGILWGILFRYAVTKKSLGSVNQKKSSPVSELIFMEELFDWCNTLTQRYEQVTLTDFNKSWRDGLAFSAILEQYDNYRVSYASILAIEDISERLTKLFFAFDKWFNLPAMVTPKELQMPPESIDDLSIIGFLTVATLHLHSKKKDKSNRSSMILSVTDVGGKAPTRIFVEGLEGVSNKVILLPKAGYIQEYRGTIGNKMKIPISTFWLYITENGNERLPSDDEYITLCDTLSITIKMVSGSSYYNSETLNVNSSSAPSSPNTKRKSKRRSFLLLGKKK